MLAPVVVNMVVQQSTVVLPMTVHGDELVPVTVGTAIVAGDTEPYTGAYEVTPLPGAEVILETSGKRMADDVTVREIPYFETTNEAGGYTVIIG